VTSPSRVRGPRCGRATPVVSHGSSPPNHIQQRGRGEPGASCRSPPTTRSPSNESVVCTAWVPSLASKRRDALPTPAARFVNSCPRNKFRRVHSLTTTRTGGPCVRRCPTAPPCQGGVQMTRLTEPPPPIGPFYFGVNKTKMAPKWLRATPSQEGAGSLESDQLGCNPRATRT